MAQVLVVITTTKLEAQTNKIIFVNVKPFAECFNHFLIFTDMFGVIGRAEKTEGRWSIEDSGTEPTRRLDFLFQINHLHLPFP